MKKINQMKCFKDMSKQIMIFFLIFYLKKLWSLKKNMEITFNLKIMKKVIKFLGLMNV